MDPIYVLLFFNNNNKKKNQNTSIYNIEEKLTSPMLMEGDLKAWCKQNISHKMVFVCLGVLALGACFLPQVTDFSHLDKEL